MKTWLEDFAQKHIGKIVVAALLLMLATFVMVGTSTARLSRAVMEQTTFEQQVYEDLQAAHGRHADFLEAQLVDKKTELTQAGRQLSWWQDEFLGLKEAQLVALQGQVRDANDKLEFAEVTLDHTVLILEDLTIDKAMLEELVLQLTVGEPIVLDEPVETFDAGESIESGECQYGRMWPCVAPPKAGSTK